MVSYLIFAFGLLCTGAVADSWNFADVSTKRDWSGELGKRRCGARRNDDGVESKDPSLDLAHRDPKCRECVAIIKEFKSYLFDNEPRKFLLTLACGQIKDSLSDHCYNLIEQHGDYITQSLVAKKRGFEICAAIQECNRRPHTVFCKACQNYARYLKAVGFENDIMIRWACAASTGYEKQQCIQALYKNKTRIMDVYDQNRDATPNEICKKAQMCPLILISKELH